MKIHMSIIIEIQKTMWKDLCSLDGSLLGQVSLGQLAPHPCFHSTKVYDVPCCQIFYCQGSVKEFRKLLPTYIELSLIIWNWFGCLSIGFWFGRLWRCRPVIVLDQTLLNCVELIWGCVEVGSWFEVVLWLGLDYFNNWLWQTNIAFWQIVD